VTSSNGQLMVGNGTTTFHAHVVMSSGNGNIEIGTGGRHLFAGNFHLLGS